MGNVFEPRIPKIVIEERIYQYNRTRKPQQYQQHQPPNILYFIPQYQNQSLYNQNMEFSNNIPCLSRSSSTNDTIMRIDYPTSKIDQLPFHQSPAFDNNSIKTSLTSNRSLI